MDAAAPPVLKHFIVAGHAPVDNLATLALAPLRIDADRLVCWNDLRLRSRIRRVVSTDRHHFWAGPGHRLLRGKPFFEARLQPLQQLVGRRRLDDIGLAQFAVRDGGP